MALASDFEGHQDYLELFFSSLWLTHSWNSSLILTFLDLSFVLQLFLIFLIFLLPLGLLKTPQFIEFGRPKFDLKYKLFVLINAGAAALMHSTASLGLRPKLSCSRVLAPRQRRPSTATLSCVHQGCVEAAPSQRRVATLHPC